MDVLDAGVYVNRFEAALPAKVQTVLWGPLQAKEMGLEGWQMQDGGETGLVMHRVARLAVGHETSSLIVVNRLKKAFLVVVLAGYPVDAPDAQRASDVRSTVAAAEAFLSRLAKATVRFASQGELALVDNVNDARVVEANAKGDAPTRALGGGRLRRGAVEEA